jgi:hypothetical protein
MIPGSRSAERGASMVLVAFSLVMLMGAAAIAVDLAALRLDRSADQKVTDSAASAGALAALDGTGQDVCEAALGYVAINAQEIGSIDDSGCATSFPSPTCDPANPEPHTVFEGRFVITVTYPVPDDDPLMTSAQLGAPTQELVADDGAPCERVAVQMSATHDSLFAQLIGFDQGTTTVHTVARAFLPPPDGPPINVLLLDRFGCEVMTASGGGSPPPGGIIIGEVVDLDTGEVFPGEGAVDSDASVGCPLDGGTIDVNGSNAVMRADGPPGCSNADPPGSGEGCGSLTAFAPGTPGCNWPACTAGGSGPNNPNPEPTAQPARLTRAPIDHRYNCRPDYSTVPASVAWAADALTTSNEQDIPGCDGPGGPEIHNLIANVSQSGLPNGSFAGPWQTWSSLHPDCSVDPGEGFSITGNVWVDSCPLLEIKDTLTVTNGSMVFDDDVDIVSSGHLIVDNDDPAGTPGFVFMRGGLIRKAGQASLSLLETMVYLSKDSRVEMNGGSTGNLIWIAPDEEDHPFDDLALWSDSTITTDTHFWAGQADLQMEGVFFVPIVTVEYQGKGVQKQTRAQFVSDKLQVSGNGVLTVAPVAGRAVDLRSVPQTMLLR